MRLTHVTSLIAVMAAGLLIAACGGGLHARHRRGGGSTANDVKFSQCMRAHGLTNFPDVIANQGLPIQHELDGSVDILVNGNPQPVNEPAFNAAMAACQHYGVDLMSASPGAGVTPGTIQKALVETAACFRHHGVPNYPDPPALGTVHKASMSPRGRAFSAGINVQSPAFKAALAKCGSFMAAAMNGK